MSPTTVQREANSASPNGEGLLKPTQPLLNQLDKGIEFKKPHQKGSRVEHNDGMILSNKIIYDVVVVPFFYFGKGFINLSVHTPEGLRMGVEQAQSWL